MLSREEFEKLPKEQQDALLQKMQEIQDITKLIQPPANTPQLSMKDFEAKIKEMMEGYIKQMTAVDRKYFAFPGIGNEGLDNLSAEGKFAKTKAFLGALIKGDVQILNTMHKEVVTKANLSEGTTTAGGYLVPEEFLMEVQRIAATYGVIRRECRIIPMKYDVINIPTAGTAEQSANWTNEAAQILQTNPNFGQCILTVNKLGSIPKVTNELLADASIDMIQYLAMLIGEAFAKAEDNQGFNGNADPFTGLLCATGFPTYPHASGTGFICLSYPDLIKLTGELYDNALPNAKLYFHRSMIAHLRSLITTAGAPIMGATAKEIAGYPLVSTEVLPGIRNAGAATDGTGYAIFGDLRKALAMGERGAMTMKISTEATVDSDNLFEKDMAALRVIERVAIGVLLPSAYLAIVT